MSLESRSDASVGELMSQLSAQTSRLVRDEMRLAHAVPSDKPSASAKILYRPVGLVSSMVGGLAAGTIFKQVWRRASPDEQSEPPNSLSTGYPFKEVLLAAAVEGAIYSVVKTVIDRQGARLFERWTGEWPGN